MGIYLVSDLCLSSSSLLAGHHEVSSYVPPRTLAFDTLPCNGPESNEVGQPWSETSEVMSQNKYFLL
jgi:hypothetical protein